MKNRNTFWGIVGIALLSYSFPTSIFAQEQIVEGVKYQTLFSTATDNPDISCYRIPALVTAPNGDLIAAIDERVPSCEDLRFSDDINIVVKISKNNGKTWSEIIRAVDFPQGYSASDPSLVVDQHTGEIFMFYNYMDLINAPKIYHFHVIKSTDNGKTWSKPTDITAQISKPAWKKDFQFITSGRAFQTTDGTLIHTLVNLKKGLHVFGSKDHGKSWFLIDTPIPSQIGNESKIIELTDGTWMINSRVQNRQYTHRFVHLSEDQGKTWTSTPAPDLTDARCNASIIRYTAKKDGYDKDRLLFSNANHPSSRENLTLKISYDEGKTWSEGKVIYPGSTAYSTLTILENGDIGLLFEKDDYTENTFVRLSLEWLTDGKDTYKKPKKRKR